MSDDIDTAAARWVIAQAGDDMDWDAFTAWLEADAMHRVAFDAMAMLDARIERARDLLHRLTASEPTPLPRSRGHMLGWGSAIAATIAGVTILTLQAQSPDFAPLYRDHRAPAGEARTIAMADGSTIALDPGSMVRVGTDRGDPVTLRGRAVFTVQHDADNPLVVRAGSYEIRDLGTTFEVSAAGDALLVAVSHGSVSVRSTVTGRVQRVTAGQSLSASDATSAWQLGSLGSRPVAPWKPGPLAYDNAPLKLVAADISRISGARLTIDADVAQHRFSGVIASGSRDAMATSLSQLTGLQVRKERDAVRLGNGSRP